MSALHPPAGDSTFDGAVVGDGGAEAMWRPGGCRGSVRGSEGGAYPLVNRGCEPTKDGGGNRMLITVDRVISALQSGPIDLLLVQDLSTKDR